MRGKIKLAGKLYTFFKTYKTKGAAQTAAKRLRSMGKLAKVVEINIHNNKVYIR